MADDISGDSTIETVDAARPTERAARDVVRLGRVVVIGGGCYGSWYAKQLALATRRGALCAREIVVVDRNATCIVAGQRDAGLYDGVPLTLVTTTWAEYLADWLSQDLGALADDAMVPSPLMPHICFDWLISRAKARWPQRNAVVAAMPSVPDLPWERGAPDGRHYVSFATWTCPVNCIEPARCPATRGDRTWSMPPALERYVRSAPSLRGPVIFHCTHRTYGVGMIDAVTIKSADARIAEWGAHEAVSVLIGTVSHCHGALGVLAVS